METSSGPAVFRGKPSNISADESRVKCFGTTKKKRNPHGVALNPHQRRRVEETHCEPTGEANLTSPSLINGPIIAQIVVQRKSFLCGAAQTLRKILSRAVSDCFQITLSPFRKPES
ncbi:MAG: hypothetical protein IPL03_14165 [Sterolibacteriaceae bacterium]|nr:hypothetical protein [Candidatus Methylophosphatis haderslevensis]